MSRDVKGITMEHPSIMRATPQILLISVIVAFATTYLSNSVAAESESAHPRAIWQSLSPAERKLPRDILVQQLLEQGKAVPPGWQKSAQARSKTAASEPDPVMYRVLGQDIDSLETVMNLLGVEIRTASPSRAYVIVMLTESQVLEVASYGAVEKIQRVKGPRAQGTTDAWTAHRFADMDDAEEPSFLVGKPALTGSNVVIAVISLPVTQADVGDLVTDNSLPPLYSDAVDPPVFDHNADPPAESPDSRLYLYSGLTGETTEGLAAVSSSGVDAGLNMVQVIRDIAPKAQIVLASPGLLSDPQDMSDLIDALVAGRGTAGSANYIPPADIIVDDLDYISQNPFEIDLVSEAIGRAETAGTLYVTAAGDDGHYLANGGTSNVLVEGFNSIAPPNQDGIFADSLFFTNLHGFTGDKYFLTVQQALTDLCLFWNEKPGDTPGDDLDLIIWNDSNSNEIVESGEVDWNFLSSPGECLQPSSQIASGSRLIIGDYAGVNEDRFFLIGERADTSFVDGSGEDDISVVFDITSSGAIRGHAYFDDALTVGGSRYIRVNDQVVSHWDTDPDGDPATDDAALAGAVVANAYSADGEIGAQRFFWQKDNQDIWQALAANDAAAKASKPDVIAASAIAVRDVTANSDASSSTAATIQNATFFGTSASAAVGAATAALYWQFREWQIAQDVLEGPVAAGDVAGAVRAATRSNTGAWNSKQGFGVIDAPRSLEGPLPPSNLSLTEISTGVMQASFNRAFNDLAANAAFNYRLYCKYQADDAAVFSNPTVIDLEPADSSSGSIAQGTKAPYTFYPPNERVGEVITCEATASPSQDQQDQGWEGTATASVSAITSSLAPPTVTMTSQSVGVAMQFAASAGNVNASYQATCTPPLADWPTANGVVTPHTSGDPPYSRPADPGVTVACTVTASLLRGANPDLTLTAQDSASASAGSPVATTVTMVPDAGGVSVRWVVDPNLATGVNASFTLLCTQGSATLVNNLSVSGASYFVEADQSAPVQCSVTTQISGTGISTINQSAVSASAAAEEEQATGLPVWLLYIATQPQ